MTKKSLLLTTLIILIFNSLLAQKNNTENFNLADTVFENSVTIKSSKENDLLTLEAQNKEQRFSDIIWKNKERNIIGGSMGINWDNSYTDINDGLEFYIASKKPLVKKFFFEGLSVGIDIIPKEKLHINGSIRGNGPSGAVNVQTDHGSLTIGSYNSSFAHIYTDRPKIIFNKDVYTTTNAFSSYNDDLTLKTKGIERLRINDINGNVGIGTKNPDMKLTVKGKIHAEEIKVDLQVPADYVFEKYYDGISTLKSDYTMPTLKEIEEFIKKHKHLPEIPSAKQIKNNGLHMKEMTNLLLQKIEELTIYTIEQEKKIEKIENENIQLRTLNDRLTKLEKLFKIK